MNKHARAGQPIGSNASRLQLSSSAFENNRWMPAEFTCEGSCYSPQLTWDGIPEGTQSFAIEMIDYDIPICKTGFVHWVVYNIPVHIRQLPAQFSFSESAQMGAVIAPNGAGLRQYYPPCPVSGTHAYTFRLFALDIQAMDPASDRYRVFKQEVSNHLLGVGTLVGCYRCQKMNNWEALITNLKLSVRKPVWK
jgi:Raf kinase inhibitor-like YbhB/YbcL family protein